LIQVRPILSHFQPSANNPVFPRAPSGHYLLEAVTDFTNSYA
jgi:hypothetical protein